VSKKLYGEKEEDKLIEEYRKEIDRQFLEAENYKPVELEEIFKYNYGDMPEDLKNQIKEHEKFLKWKETRA
jgi:pyruvate dehydrogenase E1 component alpha subunit